MQELQSMISPNTSETQHEPPWREVDAICKTHGAYRARVLDMSALGVKDHVMGCGQCAAESRAREEARKAEHMARERSAHISALLNRSGLPARFIDRSFASYVAVSAEQRRALGVCRAYAKRWYESLSEGGSLVLTGRPGTGKTHLACAIAREVTESHLAACLFVTVSAMLRAIKDTYRKGSERSEQDVINALGEPDLLILDEVGVQIGSDHEKLLMFEVLNERYQNLRPTILISNLAANELEDFLGHRIMDRYRECGSVIAFDWESHRGQRSA